MLRNLNAFEKCEIGASDGDVGRVKDLYFDDHAWAVRYLIVDTGTWLSGRQVLISPISIQKPDWPHDRLETRITREQVRNSPNIDTDKPISRQHEMQYLGYYDYPPYWGGMGLWGAGMVPMAIYPGYAGIHVDSVGAGRAIEKGPEAERARHHDDNPRLRSCEAVVGYHLHLSDGELGHVEGFLIDDESWAIRYLIINTSNWWVGHKVLIAPPWISGVHWSDKTVTVDLSRAAVKEAPPYDASAELDAQAEAALQAHYGRPPYWNPATKLDH